MKSVVTIKEGRFTIVLTPENAFEETLIEDAERESKNFEYCTTFSTRSFQTNHKTVIDPVKRKGVLTDAAKALSNRNRDAKKEDTGTWS